VELGKHKNGTGAVVLELDASHSKESKSYSAVLRIVTVEDHGTHKTVSYHLYDNTTARRLGREDVARYSAKTLEAFFDAQIEWLREDPDMLAVLNLDVNQEAPEESEDSEGSGYFEASKLIEALRIEGLDAHVWQSGGGTATLTIKREETHKEFLIGPGSYHWEAPGKSLFTTDELYAGVDVDDDRYDQETDGDGITIAPGTSIEDSAKQIAAEYRRVNNMEVSK
jgi:hypothetical protein